MSYIVFTINVASFSQCLYEDDMTNRLHDSIAVWENIQSQHYCSEAKIFLVFTGMDLLPSRLAKKPFHSVFPDYNGRKFVIGVTLCAENSPLHVVKFLRNKCLQLVQGDTKRICTVCLNLMDIHATNAFIKYSTDVITKNKKMDSHHLLHFGNVFQPIPFLTLANYFTDTCFVFKVQSCSLEQV